MVVERGGLDQLEKTGSVESRKREWKARGQKQVDIGQRFPWD